MRELWYPSLHPPRQDLALSLLYGEGFASVVPSFRHRDRHESWRDLEHLASLGLYKPIRLADVLDDPRLTEILPRRLQALEFRAGTEFRTPSSSTGWGSRGDTPKDPLGRASWPGPNDSFQVPMSVPLGDGIAGRLVDDFGFRSSADGVLSAPREVIDEVVTTAVEVLSMQNDDYVPTSRGGSHVPLADGIPDTARLAWAFRLPAPPTSWTLHETLAFREDFGHPLARIREYLANAPTPTSIASSERLAQELHSSLRRDLAVIETALKPHAGRAVAKQVCFALGSMALSWGAAAVAPDVGTFGEAGLDVLLTFATPSIAAPMLLTAYTGLRKNRGARKG